MVYVYTLHFTVEYNCNRNIKFPWRAIIYNIHWDSLHQKGVLEIKLKGP